MNHTGGWACGEGGAVRLPKIPANRVCLKLILLFRWRGYHPHPCAAGVRERIDSFRQRHAQSGAEYIDTLVIVNAGAFVLPCGLIPLPVFHASGPAHGCHGNKAVRTASPGMRRFRIGRSGNESKERSLSDSADGAYPHPGVSVTNAGKVRWPSLRPTRCRIQICF